MKIALDFLRNLENNNNREWFGDHKEDYLKARNSVISFTQGLISVIAEFDEKIANVNPEKALYRIYRDTRFSKDKTPYKNNFGANIGMGSKHDIAGYYLHIQPGESFIAAGIYMPDSTRLKEIRSEVSYEPDAFKQIIHDKSFISNFGGLSEEGKLKNVPRNFDKDDPMAEYLKLKHFIAIRKITDIEIQDKEAIKNIGDIYRSVKPLNDFLNSIFEQS